MPVLDNPKQEKACQERAKGKTEVEAYEIAGYSPNEGNANKFFARPEIDARVKEITSRGAARAEVTIESLLAELDEARALAFEVKQPSALVAATREKAVLSGNRVEKKEVGAPGEFDDISKLRDSIASDLKKLGIENISSAPVGAQGGNGKLTH